MKNDFNLKYSDDALLSRVLFLASSTEINIFVEDEGKEYEYEEIFERLLPMEIKINMIFPTGGKTKLEEAYHIFGESDEYGKCFFIADGDFDVALEREQVDAPNFLYLARYNIESYLIDKSAVIKFMRPKLKKTFIESEKIIDFDYWIEEIVPYYKKIFAIFFLLQDNNIYEIPNVAKGAAYFLTNMGLPDNEKYNEYLQEVEKYLPNVNTIINTTINKLETIYGIEATCFICGKYYIDSLSKYLISKLHKKKIDCKEFRAFLIANFDIETIDYIKEKLYNYIIS